MQTDCIWWKRTAFRRLWATIALVSLLFTSLVSLVPTTQAATVPTGYVESYTIKIQPPNSYAVYGSINHQDSGDQLTVTYYTVNGDLTCGDDGAQVYYNGTALTINYILGGSTCAGTVGLGASLYITQNNVTATVLQGTVNMTSYAYSGYKTTSWNIQNGSLGEVKLTANIPETDTDGDSIGDSKDNCVTKYNYDQSDDDQDGVGNACDEVCYDYAGSNGMQCSSCTDNSTGQSTGWTCDVDYEYNVANSWFRTNGDLECASFYDHDGYLRTEWCYPEETEYPDDYYTNNANCEYQYNTDGSPSCEICETSNGTEVKNTCPAETTTENTDNDTTSTSNTCQSYQEDGLQCSVCYDTNGNVTSDSCWSSTGSTNTTSSSCDYYMDGNLECMECYDQSGNLTNSSCWQDDGTYYNSYDDYYDNNVHCEYNNQNSGSSSTSSWCEVCTDSAGNVYNDSCSNDGNSNGGWCEGYTESNGNYCETCYNSDGSYDYSWCDDDDTNDDGGWCEYYKNGQGLQCQTCYDQNGNFTNESCDEGGAGWCEWVDDDADGVWCEVCYDDQGNMQSEQCDGNNDGNLVDDDEAQRQIKEMKENLRWREHDLKEFSRFQKRIERKVSDFEKKIEFIQDNIEWMDEEGIDTTALKTLVSEVDKTIRDLEAMLPDIQQDYTTFDEEIKAEQRILNKLQTQTDLTWDHLDAAWIILRKADIYQVKRDIIEGKLNFYDMMDNVLEWQKEKYTVLSRLGDMGIEVPEDIQANLDEAEQWIEELNTLHNEFLTAADTMETLIVEMPVFTTIEELLDWQVREDTRNWFDQELNWSWEDLRWARDGLNAHGWDNSLLWGMMEDLYQLQDSQFQDQWIRDEIQWLHEDIDVVENALNILDGRLDNKHQAIADEIRGKLPKARSMLDEMERLMDEFEGEPYELEGAMEELWQRLEKLGNFVDPKIEKLRMHIEGNWETLNLNDEEREMVERMIYEMDYEDEGDYYGDGGPHCGRNCGRLEDAYGQSIADELVNRIREDIINEIVRQVTNAVMTEVVKYLDVELTEQIVSRIMDNFQNLGGEGNALLTNTNTVFKEMTVINMDEIENENTDEIGRIAELQGSFANLPYPEEGLAAEIADAWKNVSSTLDGGDATKAELQSHIETLEALLERANQAKFEHKYEFHDVPYIFSENYDEESYWYSGYVIESAQEGILEGYRDEQGNLTYNFGPSDGTRRAEVLKMALITFGYEGYGEGENWWTPYENKARDLGLSIVNLDLSQPANRGEMMQLIFELGEREGMDGPDASQGYFPDVSQADGYWKAAETLFEEGIIEGRGDTGFADLYGSMNRAETVTILQRAGDWLEGEELFEEDLEELTEVVQLAAARSVVQPSAQDESDPTYLQWLLGSVGSFLKALFPIFR